MLLSKKQYKDFIKKAVYLACKKITGCSLRWGILTGIRPAKFARELLCKLRDYHACVAVLRRDYYVSKKKAILALDIARVELEQTKPLTSQDISLYIAIPFCVSRCDYCGFVSHSIENAGHLVADYLALLCKELVMLSHLIREKQKTIKSIYIGGGTPTSFNERQLHTLFSCIYQHFDLSKVQEYTLEAGRADTITPKKLECAKFFGVNRVSVNPQTMNDKILKQLGRNHSAQDVVDAYQAAKKIGFLNINMDVIAGLPNETVESYCNTIDNILNLAPQSITVHTLSIKKGSNLNLERKGLMAEYQTVSKMLDYSSRKLFSKSYRPYYVYRQKSILGNLENVGYSKPGYEGLYNIYMMEEVMTILSVGAGGVSKILSENDKITRVFNYKYPYEYIRDFSKVEKNLTVLRTML
jgi:oxygen-independent coproporphyrinogen-3 oxidase